LPTSKQPILLENKNTTNNEDSVVNWDKVYFVDGNQIFPADSARYAHPDEDDQKYYENGRAFYNGIIYVDVDTFDCSLLNARQCDSPCVIFTHLTRKDMLNLTKRRDVFGIVNIPTTSFQLEGF